MDASRRLGLVILTVVLLSYLCHVGQAETGEQLKSIFNSLRRSNWRSEVTKGHQGFVNPFAILGHLLSLITLPIRLPYRLVMNLIATVALLLLGCRVVPEVQCAEDVSDKVPEFLNTLREELEFFARFADDESAAE